MNPKWHGRLTQAFLVANSMFWLPWGLINLIKPKSWSGEVIPGMEVYDLSSPVARTEVRAMYGGLQMAIGTAALIGAARDKHRDSALGFFVLALSGLSICRWGGHGRGRRVHLPVFQHQDRARQVQPSRLGHVRAAQHILGLAPLAAAAPRSQGLNTQSGAGSFGRSLDGLSVDLATWLNRTVLGGCAPGAFLCVRQVAGFGWPCHRVTCPGSPPPSDTASPR